MNAALEIVLVAIGVFLLITGFNASESLGSEISRFFTGTPTDRSMWLVPAGLLATISGFYLGFGRRWEI